MYKVVIKTPDLYADHIRAIIGQSHMGMPLIGGDDTEPGEQIEFLCQSDRLQSVVEQINNLDVEDDISLDIYNLGAMHD